MIVLGLDLGLAHTGWALTELEPGYEKPEVLSIGLVETEKAKRPKPPRVKKGQPKPKRVKWVAPSASVDNLRRAEEIALVLHQKFASAYEKPDLITVEAMSHPRSASAAAKMAICWGILASLRILFPEVPVVQVTPTQIKKRFGCKTKDKQEVIDALNAVYTKDNLLENGTKDVIPSKWEHPYDALGTILTAQALGALEISKG